MSRVTTALLRNGYSVLIPSEDNGGYDLVAEKGGKFFRIQVKCSEKRDPERNRYGFMTSRGSTGKDWYTKESCDYIICWGMEDDLFWVFRPRDCQSKNKKCYAKTGSSWRIVSDL